MVYLFIPISRLASLVCLLAEELITITYWQCRKIFYFRCLFIIAYLGIMKFIWVVYSVTVHTLIDNFASRRKLKTKQLEETILEEEVRD